ncbi:hypothetical protein O163_04005 [Caldanaerobacter subterraneus subsp. yonseiensis KB-1]|uniref:Uncharacterized protein n=1 Tax=Caldanaerobacter subterraneus subsp. yonseiensis KB-1 TaxID=1388761 RepID=U5CS90_CALSX|nr:hypothetical protein O163_04005 [Caldanaerobacter subterraneus subsp. yonseiensis KB-1]
MCVDATCYKAVTKLGELESGGGASEGERILSLKGELAGTPPEFEKRALVLSLCVSYALTQNAT